MLPRSPRARAADDFPAIRARMEELRRERAEVAEDDGPRPTIWPRPSALGTRPGAAKKPPALTSIRRAILRIKRS
jgi:hypothetical protein